MKHADVCGNCIGFVAFANWDIRKAATFDNRESIRVRKFGSGSITLSISISTAIGLSLLDDGTSKPFLDHSSVRSKSKDD